MTRSTPLHASFAVLFDSIIVLLYALFLAVPRLYPAVDRTASADAPTSGSTTLAWLALPVGLSHHGVSLAYATIIVTSTALIAATLGALVSIAARLHGSAAMWAAGSWMFGCSVAILMPAWIATGFLGALLLVVALRSRFVPLMPLRPLAAVMAELWPAGYAIGFAVFVWRYNPQLLLQCLLIAFGASLVGRAVLPSSAHSASS